jgi:hypothetical protein
MDATPFIIKLLMKPVISYPNSAVRFVLGELRKRNRIIVLIDKRTILFGINT